MRAAPGKARFSIMAITTIEQAAAALKFEIAGMVQGVGFRPHVYRLAVRHGLKGFVRNTESGVEIHVEGESGAPERFWTALMDGLPEHARVYGVERTVCEPAGFEEFRIEESDSTPGGVPVMLPDLAPCPECLEEMRDAFSAGIIIRLPTVRTAVPAIPLLRQCRMTARAPA